MGVRGLLQFLRKKPAIITPFADGGWGFIQGKTVAVDTPIFAHRAANVADGNVLVFFERMIAKCLANASEPVYVFDGTRHHALKAREHARRARQCTHSVKKPSARDYNTLKSFFFRRGCRVVLAFGDAEQKCAQLCASGNVDIVLSDDSDSLAFGAPRTVFRFGTPYAYCIDLEHCLAELNLTYPQFVDFCVLCGNDYIDRVPRVGPVRALRLIQTHGSIARIIATPSPCKYGKLVTQCTEFVQNHQHIHELFEL